MKRKGRKTFVYLDSSLKLFKWAKMNGTSIRYHFIKSHW